MNVRPSNDLVRAVHQSRPFSIKGMLERLFTFWFDGLVYNQIWEDPRVDLEGLQLNGSSRLLTISSGGCNILNYLTVEPESIAAVDLNPSHLALTRLKLAAAAYLPSYEDFFRFFGCADDELNLLNYARHLRHRLDERTRDFWEGGSWLRRKLRGPRIEYFAKNLYNFGSMGLFIRLTHALAGLKGIDTRRFLNGYAQEERERLYEENFVPVLTSLPARMLVRLPFLLHALGVPPAQLERLRSDEGGDLLSVYNGRVRRLVCDFPLEDNYFAWQALARCYDRVERNAIPDYLKAHNFPVLRSNVHRVQTHLATLTAFLSRQPDDSLNRFVFLDAQDWMNTGQINELWTEVARAGQPGSRIVFRTGGSVSVIEPALEPNLRARLVYEEELSRDLFRRDRSAIYGGFHVYELIR